jgi:hypothetical protein
MTFRTHLFLWSLPCLSLMPIVLYQDYWWKYWVVGLLVGLTFLVAWGLWVVGRNQK